MAQDQGNRRVKAVLKAATALTAAICMYKSRHYIGAFTKLAPLAWRSYQYTQQQNSSGEDLDPFFFANQVLDCQLSVGQINAIVNIARWAVLRHLGEGAGYINEVSARVAHVDYGFRSVDGGRVEDRTCTVELELCIGDVRVPSNDTRVVGATACLEVVILLPRAPDANPIAVSASLVSLRPRNQVLMSGKLKFGDFELDLHRLDSLLGRDLAWFEHDSSVVLRNMGPSMRLQVGGQGRFYPYRESERPLSLFVSARLPKVPSWMRAEVGGEVAEGKFDGEEPPAGEGPQDCVEFHLRFGLKPGAKSFDVKRFFGSVKPIVVFAQGQLPEGSIELINEADLELPVLQAGSLQPPAEDAPTQRALVLGLRLRPEATTFYKDLLAKLEAHVESLRVEAGVSLELSFAEIWELLAHLLSTKAGPVAAEGEEEDAAVANAGSTGLKPRLWDSLLQALDQTQCMKGVVQRQQQRQQQPQQADAISLTTVLREQLEQHRAEGAPQGLSTHLPAQLVPAIQTMDRNLQKIASQLLGIVIALPRRDARLEISLAGVDYQDLQKRL